MSQEVTKAEVQLCMAAKNIRKRSFTNDDLRAFGGMAFKDELQDWSAALGSFCRRNFFHEDGGRYSLTAQGEKYVERVVASEFFGKMLARAERSPSFARFCQRVYGRNLTQFGTADMNQLEHLIAVLGLNEQSLALDIGCGIGSTTEYISDLTGARITGIDLAEACIARQRENPRQGGAAEFFDCRHQRHRSPA